MYETPSLLRTCVVIRPHPHFKHLTILILDQNGVMQIYRLFHLCNTRFSLPQFSSATKQPFVPSPHTIRIDGSRKSTSFPRNTERFLASATTLPSSSLPHLHAQVRGSGRRWQNTRHQPQLRRRLRPSRTIRPATRKTLALENNRLPRPLRTAASSRTRSADSCPNTPVMSTTVTPATLRRSAAYNSTPLLTPTSLSPPGPGKRIHAS